MMTKALDIVQAQFRRTFSKKKLKKRLPITSWIPTYSIEDLLGDLVAGLTVGLTVIPQGMAYAVVAGLPPNIGLYSSFMGCFVYVIFGSCKDITIGPTAIMSIMTKEYSVVGNPDFAILLTFLSGCIIFSSGILGLGFLILFISNPVICGFTSAAAITIGTSQLKGILGISYSADGFIDDWVHIADQISETRWQDVVLGVSCMILLLLMKKLKDIKAAKILPSDELKQIIFKKIIFLVSVGSNAIIVICALILAYCLDENQPFSITGDVKPGLPEVMVPPFTTSVGNDTLSFSDMISQLGAGVAIIPLVSIIESISIASAFSAGKTVDGTQEMIALGLCNIASSFFQSMPITGSFSRTAVNSNSGVRTPAGGIATGMLVIIALAFLTSSFKYIPKAALSAVIICAVIFMIDYEVILPVWRVRRLDQIPLWVSFFICLFWKLEYGIVIGALVNVCLLLFGIARPSIDIEVVMENDSITPRYVKIEPHIGLFFPTVAYVRSTVTKASMNQDNKLLPVVVDCKHLSGIDYTAAKGIKGLAIDFRKLSQKLLFVNVRPNVEAGMYALDKDLAIISSDKLDSFLSGFSIN